MQRWTLARTVMIPGADVLGRPSALTVEPLHGSHDDWVWWVNGQDVRIKPNMLHPILQGRTVQLRHKNWKFNEFEHVAFLHTLGLRGVRISITGNWPPYMCSAKLWTAVYPHLQLSGTLSPYKLDASDVVNSDRGMMRRVEYVGNTDGIYLSSYVNYEDGKEGTANLELPDTSSTLPYEQILTMVSARTLGRPTALFPFLWVLPDKHWPHWNKILWRRGPLDQTFYNELAWHKLLYGCLVSFAAPPEHYLSGTIMFHKSNHPMDLRLLRLRTLEGCCS